MTSKRMHIVPEVDTPLLERTDDELMALAQAGMRVAFSVLVERYASRVVSVCFGYTNDGQLAVELAQETWVTVWEQRDRYRPRERFLVWLITAARNRCRNHLRHRKVVNFYRYKFDSSASLPPEQIDQILAQEQRRLVRDELSRLPRHLEEALLLRYAEELRYDQMAEILGARESTLRSRVLRGLRQLRKRLERRL